MNKELEDAYRQLGDIHFKIDQIIKKCVHKIMKPKHSFDNMAICSECDKEFGFYCPDSPDHICHYYHTRDNGIDYICILSGERYVLSSDHTPMAKDYDVCMFCHLPKSRY